MSAVLESIEDNPLSSGAVRYLVRQRAVADGPGDPSTRPFGLGGAVSVPAPTLRAFRYSHEFQIAVDAESGVPLIELGKKGKDWTTKATSDGDEGPEEGRAVTVVIFAQEADAPVDAVVQELSRRNVPVFRADMRWFPRQLTLDAKLTGRTWTGSLATAERTVELSAIRSIWYRDPTAFEFPPELTDVERAYAHREARLGFGGVLAALGVRWVNHPNRAADAMYKPVQLATASACGLSVKPTLVTNRPDAARRFIGDRPEQVVCKSLGPNTITEGDQVKISYTRRLADSDLAELGGVASTATQLQDWVEKAFEARIVAVGATMFTIAIDTDSPTGRTDWRADFPSLRYDWIDTPPDIASALREYLHTLGLAYAAFDFAIDTDGRWWFLESNSSGQYGWLEAHTGAPITNAIADLLAEETTP